MKSGKDHRVPLSDRAVELIPTENVGDKDFVFPGGRSGQPLSNMAMLKLLERIGRDDLTVHGFRSTFRDWTSERTNFANEVIEMALAHTIESKTEAAYRRGGLFEKRRLLVLIPSPEKGTVAVVHECKNAAADRYPRLARVAGRFPRFTEYPDLLRLLHVERTSALVIFEC